MDSQIFNEALGSIIKDYIAKKGITLNQFAKSCEISKSLMYSLIKGTHVCGLCKLSIEKIACGMNLNYYKLNELIKQYISKNEKEHHNEIIIDENSKLYPLFNAVKDLSDENIEMLHSFALKLK